jgi:hypothetical protein
MDKFHTSSDFLRRARAAARRTGYDPAKLELSDDGEHKLVYNSPDGLKRFGRRGYGDFIYYSLFEPAIADIKRKSYRARAGAIRDSGKFSPNQLALRILW